MKGFQKHLYFTKNIAIKKENKNSFVEIKLNF